jgi:hypothetical protein
MTPLSGYDGRFGLRCWRVAGRGEPTRQEASDDVEALRERAVQMVETGDYVQVELASWNFELNDWVRMESFAAPVS